jgi:Zn-dependent protease with chaperone function
MKEITRIDFKKARHPKENSRFILALAICIPVLVVTLISTFATFGIILLFIGLILFLFWFGLKILETNMIGNSVRVSEINFPEIYSICEEIKVSMGYKKSIRIFIIEEGGFNAFLAKFFKTKFIILTSSLADDMTKEQNILQLKWVIARFIGSLQTKQIRLDFLRVLIESIDSIKIFSLFILPYQRATQYTGDNIGLLYCENVEQVLIAFTKFMVGTKLCDKVHFNGIAEQGKEINHTLFSLIARIPSSHPHTIDRHLNLLAYARKEFPEMFEKYMSENGGKTTLDIGNIPSQNN